MSFTGDLLRGIAQHLDDVGVGVYRPDTVLQAGETAITLKGVPTAPDRAISLTTYPVEAEGWGAEVLIGLNVRTRGVPDDTTDVDDVADDVYEALHGLAGTFGGIAVPGIFHQSGSPLGPDKSGRHERSDNFYLRAAHGTASLI